MLTIRSARVLAAAACIATASAAAAQPQAATESITYQGRLTNNGAPLNGQYEFLVEYYENPTTANGPLSSELVIADVTDGLFSIELSPDAVLFNGLAVFAEISVGDTMGGPKTTLSPRVELGPAPYALFALDAPTPIISWNSLADTPAGFADGVDNDTTYVAGTGLSLNGTAFSLNLTYTDSRYINAGESAGGDLSGLYPSPTVTALRGRPVSSSTPSIGQSLFWSGTQWTPGTFVDTDTNTTYTAGLGLILSGTQFLLDTTPEFPGTYDANAVNNFVFRPGFDFSVFAADDVDINAQDDIFIDGESLVDIDALTELDIVTPFADFNITTEFDVTGPLIDLNAQNNIESSAQLFFVSASNDIDLNAADDIFLDAESEVDVSTNRFDVLTAGEIELTAGSIVDIDGQVIDVDSPSIDINGSASLILRGALIQANTANFQATGAVFKPGGGVWGILSDGRLKKNVENLTGSLELVNALHPVTWEYNNPDHWGYAPGEFAGFAAQEVRDIKPEWVTENDDGTLMIQPQGIEAHLVAAVQDLSDQLEAEREKNAALEQRLLRLERALAHQ